MGLRYDLMSLKKWGHKQQSTGLQDRFFWAERWNEKREGGSEDIDRDSPRKEGNVHRYSHLNIVSPRSKTVSLAGAANPSWLHLSCWAGKHCAAWPFSTDFLLYFYLSGSWETVASNKLGAANSTHVKWYNKNSIINLMYLSDLLEGMCVLWRMHAGIASL